MLGRVARRLGGVTIKLDVDLPREDTIDVSERRAEACASKEASFDESSSGNGGPSREVPIDVSEVRAEVCESREDSVDDISLGAGGPSVAIML